MKNICLLLSLFILTGNFSSFSQTIPATTADSLQHINEIKGVVYDGNAKTALPYTNIYVLHKHTGTISNEKGHFTLNISELEKTDTVRFQYVGYKTRKITIEDLEKEPEVYLKEEIISLSELVVFATEPDVVEIVKNVLRNKEKNYKPAAIKTQTFIRNRDIADFSKLDLNYKKSSIDEIDRQMIAMAEEKIPRNFTSYTDFLGYIYFKPGQEELGIKVDPIRTVSLKEKDVSDLMQIAKIFEEAFDDTGEDEYWKVKSGIFGQKLDSTEISTDIEKDTVNDNRQELSYYRNSIKWKLGFSTLEDKDEWEFLHSTGKYKYSLAGGTRVNGEEVYIIDFEPKRSGLYQGRMFVSMETYALIRADYAFAPGKTSTDFHLLGVGYTEKYFAGSIFFEKRDSSYFLKYFSRKETSEASFDRSLALMKKKKRWLFDKTLKELKIGLDLNVDLEQSLEWLVIDYENISTQSFDDFNQKEFQEFIYVDQFNDELWKDFSIIEPTEQMREYKKQAAE